MSYINEEILLHNVIKDFFHILEEGDKTKFLEFWHPQARGISVGKILQLNCFNTEEIIANSMQRIKNRRKENPDQNAIKFLIEKIVRVKIIENTIAAAEVKWYSLDLSSKNNHYAFIHFVRQNDKWLILNILDRECETALENNP